MPDTVGSEQCEPTSLWGIANRAKACKRHRFRDLYRELDERLLWKCWFDLNKQAASGVDRVTVESYRHNLAENIQDLAERLKTKRYRAQWVRRSDIPKADGGERPLGIPALEDKLVQMACTKRLSAIDEQDFLDSSHGYRANRSAKAAVTELTFELQYGRYGYVVEADIQGFFDHMDHEWLLRMLAQRIDDRAFIGLIRKWLKAGVLERDGAVVHPESGTPQGGIISPILANIYLHYALNLWFERVVKRCCRGSAHLCVYADDFVCAFQYRRDARRFYKALGQRLAKFGLSLAPHKTRILRFSRFAPTMRRRFTFLGFELFWFRDRQGVPRVKRRTSRKKLQGARRGIKHWIRVNRHLPGRIFAEGLFRRLRGHYNYYGLHGNFRSLQQFHRAALAAAYKWLNRRGGKRSSFSWAQFHAALERLGVPKPRIHEPKPQRMAAG